MRSNARSSARALRVLVVDDHALFVDGLTLLLQKLGQRVEVQRAESCERAVELLRSSSPQLILFDLALPGVSQLPAFQLLREHAPAIPIVAVSADDRPRAIAELIRAGARGYIPKALDGELALNALRLVLAGGTYIPESAIVRGSEHVAAPTPRERQVLELLASGRGNKEIAASLGISESTVRVYVTSLARRLGVRSRHDIVGSPHLAQLLARPSSAGARRDE